MADAWGNGTSNDEWAVLSSIEASLQRDAPRFARQFDALGHDGVQSRTWAVLALIWLAGAVVLATFTFSLPLAFVGLAAMGAALALLVAFEFRPTWRSRVPMASPLTTAPGVPLSSRM